MAILKRARKSRHNRVPKKRPGRKLEAVAHPGSTELVQRGAKLKGGDWRKTYRFSFVMPDGQEHKYTYNQMARIIDAADNDLTANAQGSSTVRADEKDEKYQPGDRILLQDLDAKEQEIHEENLAEAKYIWEKLRPVFQEIQARYRFHLPFSSHPAEHKVTEVSIVPTPETKEDFEEADEEFDDPVERLAALVQPEGPVAPTALEDEDVDMAAAYGSGATLSGGAVNPAEEAFLLHRYITDRKANLARRTAEAFPLESDRYLPPALPEFNVPLTRMEQAALKSKLQSSDRRFGLRGVADHNYYPMRRWSQNEIARRMLLNAGPLSSKERERLRRDALRQLSASSQARRGFPRSAYSTINPEFGVTPAEAASLNALHRYDDDHPPPGPDANAQEVRRWENARLRYLQNHGFVGQQRRSIPAAVLRQLPNPHVLANEMAAERARQALIEHPGVAYNGLPVGPHITREQLQRLHLEELKRAFEEPAEYQEPFAREEAARADAADALAFELEMGQRLNALLEQAPEEAPDHEAQVAEEDELRDRLRALAAPARARINANQRIAQQRDLVIGEYERRQLRARAADVREHKRAQRGIPESPAGTPPGQKGFNVRSGRQAVAQTPHRAPPHSGSVSESSHSASSSASLSSGESKRRRHFQELLDRSSRIVRNLNETIAASQRAREESQARAAARSASASPLGQALSTRRALLFGNEPEDEGDEGDEGDDFGEGFRSKQRRSAGNRLGFERLRNKVSRAYQRKGYSPAEADYIGRATAGKVARMKGLRGRGLNLNRQKNQRFHTLEQKRQKRTLLGGGFDSAGQGAANTTGFASSINTVTPSEGVWYDPHPPTGPMRTGCMPYANTNGGFGAETRSDLKDPNWQFPKGRGAVKEALQNTPYRTCFGTPWGLGCRLSDTAQSHIYELNLRGGYGMSDRSAATRHFGNQTLNWKARSYPQNFGLYPWTPRDTPYSYNGLDLAQASSTNGAGFWESLGKAAHALKDKIDPNGVIAARVVPAVTDRAARFVRGATGSGFPIMGDYAGTRIPNALLARNAKQLSPLTPGFAGNHDLGLLHGGVRDRSGYAKTKIGLMPVLRTTQLG